MASTRSDNAGYRGLLLRAYAAAIDSVSGRGCVAAYLAGHPPVGAVHVAAVGKAASDMTAGALDALGDTVRSALVITKHGHTQGLFSGQPSVRCLESSHPVPDESSLRAGEALLDFVHSAPPDAAFLFLISGGASALVEVLPCGYTADSLARMNQWLLGSGFPIAAINRVRKRASRIKGGRLAGVLARRAALNLMISDVPDDDPKAIGSGLLVAHEGGDMDLGALALPEWLQAMVTRAPPLPNPDVFAGVSHAIVARPADARAAARTVLAGSGYSVHLHTSLVEGDAVEAGRRLAAEVMSCPPGVHIWAGETTVVLPDAPGRGGRCQSLALAAAMELRGDAGVWFLAAGTDGTDGPGRDAGALVDSGTLARGARAHLDAADCLARADAGTFLEASGALIYTGPTGTNVMDLIIALKAES